MKNILRKSYAKVVTCFFLLAGVVIPINGWSDYSRQQEAHSGIFIAAKAFDSNDCQKYLDRNLLAKGYQPIQIIIKNHTDRAVVFSPEDVNLSMVSVDEVIARAETSTAGRSGGYGAAAFFVSGLFVIPAIVDGAKSSTANGALSADYHHKAAKKQTIQPNSMLNKLIFVPKDRCPSSFKVILAEKGSNRTYEQDVLVRKAAHQGDWYKT
ncbi:MAG: hypothetical protein H6620_09825 [Halobacteriovoraceae bacterium]|nr:hypothetical protein [Halobacteriovoraceae bacterium]